MEDVEYSRIKAKNYKCFGKHECGFDTILPINLIIGRNNSGKSSMLDLIQYATNPHSINNLGHKGNSPEILITTILKESNLKGSFSPAVAGGDIPGDNQWEFGKKWIAKPITFRLNENRKRFFVSIDPQWDSPKAAEIFNRVLSNVSSPIETKSFKRLVSDRDVRPEEMTTPLSISPNGEGATNIISNYLTKANLPTSSVKNTLLEELNKIFQPDVTFTDISVQQINGNWEVYLSEINKGSIPLSQSGSGIKTVLLVLIFLYMIPEIENKPLRDYYFGFEELENNLHPALIRRLFLYLREIALEKECAFFLTTHSNVVIDLFGKDEISQILHIQHDGIEAKVTRVTTYIQNKGILDDLDVRASDLLQANCVVWVEGPSDILYFRRWIDIWAEEKLTEGIHYQCVFYGGRLLAHLSADDPDMDKDELVKILKVNRNAILLIDSDRDQKGARINKTKQRIVNEIKQIDGFSWVTAGKEIENYIPIDALQELYPQNTHEKLGEYEALSDYLDRINLGEGKRFLKKKVLFAANIIQYFTKENLSQTLDLKSKLNTVCSRIRNWNGINT